MSTTQPSEFRSRAKQATKHHPFSSSDEYLDTRLGSHALNANGDNSTYLGVTDDQLTDHASEERINLYSRLELYNRGTHNGKWTRNQSKKHDNDDFLRSLSITSQMGLPDWQKRAVWRLFKGLKMQMFKRFDTPKGVPEYKQDLVIFCLGALLYNRNLPERCEKWSYYPGKEYECKSNRYARAEARLKAQQQGDRGDGHRIIERAAEQLGFEEDDIGSCYQMVASKFRGYFNRD